ncbi:hypothetical protein [Priestia megaterium]|uniref:hypothetical protein n=1 Tax=Priestia megaterium TaxID=1404 RepID=UPI001FB1B2DD|nr:hypothetical protein [Priestia megaterium]
MNGNLKEISPSSSPNNKEVSEHSSDGRGRLTLERMSEYNRDSSNNVISSDANKLENLLMQGMIGNKKAAL